MTIAIVSALRDLPDELLGATGVPGIAVPEGVDHGNFVSGDDADRAIDLYIERQNKIIEAIHREESPGVIAELHKLLGESK